MSSVPRSHYPGPRTPASRWRRSRRFNLFVLGTLLISAALLTVTFLQEDVVAPSGSSELDGDTLATFAILDVGQALSAAVVTRDGASLVYDFGLSRDNAENVIIPFLEEHDVSEIDYAVLSHPHQDHLGGLPALLESMPVGLFIDPVLETTNQTYLQSLVIIEDEGISTAVARQGDTYPLGEHVEFEILWPTDDLLLENDGAHRLNDNSAVIRVTASDVSLLLTGDLEQDGEQILVDTYGENLRTEILQVAHHGSNTSSQDVFLASAGPSVSVIPVGADNQYGHPHSEVMQRLRQHALEIYRTDVDGTVIIQTDGETYDVTTTRTEQSWAIPRSSQPWTILRKMPTGTTSASWYSMTGSN